jgi:uncharacterized protein YerC
MKRPRNSRYSGQSSAYATSVKCAPFWSISARLLVAELLDRNLPYRQIHDRTGVSVTTIGRVARYLNSGAGGYSKALQRRRK